jgi:transposase
MKQEVATVGLDLAKNVFQVHAIGADGAVLVRRKLRRAEVIGFFTDLPSCLVGMEACASAHHWARELIALGHEVRLMPPAYVKPYVKRGKTDAADAEAICEAVTRPTMRFVAVKSVEQQAVLMLHKSRDLMVRQRTMLINALRGHLAEYGIVTGIGAGGVTAMLKALHERQEELPAHARSALHRLAAQLRALDQRDRQIGSADPRVAPRRRDEPAARHDPGHRPDHRVGHIGRGARCVVVPIRTPVRSMARTHASSEQLRRQGTAGRDHQAGRWLLTAAACGRRDSGDAYDAQKR